MMLKVRAIFISMREKMTLPAIVGCSVRLASIFFLLLSIVQPAISQQISIGIRAPLTPFMWASDKGLNESKLSDSQKQRWMFLQSNLDNVLKSGGKWNIVIVRQWLGDVASKRGREELERLHRVIAEHEKRGLTVVFRVIEDPSLYSHLRKTEDNGYGFNAQYFDWLQILAREFGDKVKIFLIGNEAEINIANNYHWHNNAPKEMRIGYDEYSKVMLTASKAIHSVRNDIQIANSGFSDKTVAFAVADQIYREHGITEAQEFWSAWKSTGGTRAEGIFGLLRLLHESSVKRRIQFLKQAIREPDGSDLFQLHYYGGWRGLQPILNWLNNEMSAAGTKRPIIAAEVGYLSRVKKVNIDGKKVRRILDRKYYSEDEHAQNIVKTFATLFGNGVTKALYWSIRDSNDYGPAVRLYESTKNNKDFKPNNVNRAFRMLGETLNGLKYQSQKKMPKMNGVWEFRFVGKSDVSLVWGSGKILTAELQDAKEVRDIEGRVLNKSDYTKPLSGALYVFW